jgi:hypothetical protein
MRAAEGRRGIFRPGQKAGAADGCSIGKPADAARAEKTRRADPRGVV